jgi:ABC-type phosphate transport system substrate-binding protein
MGLPKRRTAALCGLALLWAVPPAWPAEGSPFKVIVSPSVPGSSIRREALTEIFLGRVAKWSDGRPIKPVDLSLTSPVRLGFTREVLGMTSLEVLKYWEAALSRGRLPPPTKGSEGEVIAFVAANEGAVGYVAEATPTHETVKVLRVQ